jgi:hypothetical protein
MAGRAGAGIIESPASNDIKRESEDYIRVPLGTSEHKEGADVAGREQTPGRKETQKQKKTLQAQPWEEKL